MRKTFFIIIALTLMTHIAYADISIELFSKGDGSATSPYIIEKASQLMFMSFVVNSGTPGYDTAHYKLATDINLENELWNGIGTITNSFKGHFDGDNHTISNLRIANNSSETICIGLFGQIDNALVKNITIKGSVSINKNSSVQDYCGGICGQAKNSLIYNCHNECEISVKGENNTMFSLEDMAYVGGICGYAVNSEIFFCHNSNTLSTESSTNGSTESTLIIGGICGHANNTKIKCCYNDKKITVKSSQSNNNPLYLNKATHYAGGICGYAEKMTEINSCYNAGSIQNNSTAASGNIMNPKLAGGICGYQNKSLIVNASFIKDAGCSSTQGGAEVDASIMKTDAFVQMLNMSNPLAFVLEGNNTFPSLNKIYDIHIGTSSEGEISVSATDFFNGKEITLTATPAVGFHFLKWNDENTDNPRQITVTKNDSIRAIFEINKYEVSVILDDETGTVSGAAEYNHGDTVSLVATAKIGYKFANWNGSITADSIGFIVENDTTITANFDKMYKALAATSDSAKGLVAIEGLDSIGFCEKDSIVSFTANAKEGFRFIKWADGDTANPRAVSVTSDTTMSAYFAVCHTVATLSDNEWGYVVGGGIYEHDSTALLMAVAKQWVTGGFGFLKWNDGNRENPRRITVTKDTLLAAIFTTHDTVYVHDTLYIHDTINVTSVTSKEAIDVSIYPNPTLSFVNVSASSFFSYILTDARGVVLRREDENTSFLIDMSEYADGVYFITTSDGRTHKIVKN